MFTTKTVFAVIATIAAVSVGAHAADRQTNPLHPAYYAERNTGEFAATAGPAQYADAGNPLHPAFARHGSTRNWPTIVKGEVSSYADAHNPLHPSYRRS
jgi:hypothetical protein